MSGEAAWWQGAFAADYLTVYAHRDAACAAHEVAGLLPRLRGAPGPVLDAGCGSGRHLVHLRAAGLTACGFDWSPDLLAAASAQPGCRGRVARGDLRAPPLAGGWGAVLLLFTAFGYFDDQANARCLAALARLLAPGGWLVVDLPDDLHLRRNLVPHSLRRCGEVEIEERRRLDGTRVEKQVELRRPGAPTRSWRESVRIYPRDEFTALARAHGLEAVDCWPGLGGPDDDAQRAVHWLRAARA